MSSALAKLEEIYSMALNPDEDYYAQLEPLAANGELANHNSSFKVILALCKIIDEQAKRIEAVEADRRNGAGYGGFIVKSDPTKPLV